MAPEKKVAALTSGEKTRAKKAKALENAIKSNPERAAANKLSADAKRERRKESGSTKKLG